MKTKAAKWILIILLGAGMWLNAGTAKAHRVALFPVFYTELSPYGTWINTPQYGTVWIPDAGPSFHPYSTGGYWDYTLYGWTWVSYYPWGWAPFHYGRWYFDNWYGWVWVPGDEWGPGWVAWRQCDGYYGWAPMTPGFNVSIHIDIDLPFNNWVFIPAGHFGRHDMERFYMDRRDNERLYHRSGYVVNSSVDRETRAPYYTGPAVKEVARATGREIKPAVVDRNRTRNMTPKETPPANGRYYSRPAENRGQVTPKATPPANGRNYSRPPENRGQVTPKTNPGMNRTGRNTPDVREQKTAKPSAKTGYQSKPNERKATAPKQPDATKSSDSQKPTGTRHGK